MIYHISCGKVIFKSSKIFQTIRNVFASIATEESATDLHCPETAEVEESVEIPEDCSVSGFLNIMKTSLFNNWKVDSMFRICK